jgi:hypothetical protein
MKNKIKNITTHDLIIAHIVRNGNFATHHPMIKTISRIVCPKKPIGKNTMTTNITKIINFNDGLNR